MSGMRQFPDATEEELRELVSKLFDTAILWAKMHDFGGLSAAPQWNVYNAIEDAIHKHSIIDPNGETAYYRATLQRIYHVESKPGSDIQLICKTALNHFGEKGL